MQATALQVTSALPATSFSDRSGPGTKRLGVSSLAQRVFAVSQQSRPDGSRRLDITPKSSLEALGSSCMLAGAFSKSKRWSVKRPARCMAGSSDDSGPDFSPEGEIPATTNDFLRKVSSRAYSQLGQQVDDQTASSYSLLDSNPWRGSEKAVFVLARGENGLFTMKTRKDRSDVENELSKLFPKRGSRRGYSARPANEYAGGGRFSMHVDTICDGVLMFEDQNEAFQYSRLLEREGARELAVAEIEASEVFQFCMRSKAVAILFRQGSNPPAPQRLRSSLGARKHSLED